MKAKSKKTPCALILTGCALLGYVLWLLLRPVEIIAVHQRRNYSDVLITNFPLTDRGKINWWLKNKDMLKSRHGIPKPASYGNFTVIFWDFGDGYKEEGKYDRLCFDDMKSKKNCIDKNKVFSVQNDRNNDMLFSVYDGMYRMKKNAEMVKTKYK